jgi:RWD domain
MAPWASWYICLLPARSTWDWSPHQMNHVSANVAVNVEAWHTLLLLCRRCAVRDVPLPTHTQIMAQHVSLESLIPSKHCMLPAHVFVRAPSTPLQSTFLATQRCVACDMSCVRQVAEERGVAGDSGGEGAASNPPQGGEALLRVKHLPPICLRLRFPAGYPLHEAPHAELSALWLTPRQLSALKGELDRLWQEQVCLEHHMKTSSVDQAMGAPVWAQVLA